MSENHKAYYAIEKMIDEAVEKLDKEDLSHAYWVNYDSERGYLEDTIVIQYIQRQLEEMNVFPCPLCGNWNVEPMTEPDECGTYHCKNCDLYFVEEYVEPGG